MDKDYKALPESDISEWKWSWRNEYLKWIAAFANTDGGTLHIGVNDDGYVVGLKNHRKLLESIPNAIRDKLHITPKVRLLWTDKPGTNIRYPGGVPSDIASKDINRYVCGSFTPKNEKEKAQLEHWKQEIPVTRDSDGRYYYIEIIVEPYSNLITYDGVAYSRSGSTLQILSGQELERAVLKSAGLTWDAITVAGKSLSDLDHEALDTLRKKAIDKKRLTPEMANVSDQKLVESIGLLGENGELTRAAIMLFSNPERIVSGSYIKIGFFAPAGTYGENSVNDVIYNDTVHGALISQADKAIEILYSKYLKALISYSGIQRVESYIIPQDAMREIILNAVAHKFYPSGNPIQIKVYDDHITVMNEGFWPFDKLKVEDAYDQEHSSYPTNPLIAEGLYMAGDIETWGTGFDKIRLACGRYGTPLPVIEATKGSVTIRIKASEGYLELMRRRDKSADQSANPPIRQSADSADLKERHKQILSLMEVNKEYSSDEIGELIGLKSSRSRQLLKELVDMGKLESVGTTYGKRYIKKG